eukprot:TRINITY_DN12973_c0_g1_i2.p1 TRINITY_DN12973_c0_g1~~TRINITY_DN12973_c0_g1_i2.p1  ORF type:complete len:272 (+),score=27.81 TRINITY_DN12973_c0_g1_i2:86-901(+)
MAAILARSMVGLLRLTACFTAASENASDTRRVVETLGSPASFRGFTNTSSNLDRSAAARGDVNVAAETEDSGALPSSELEENSTVIALMCIQRQMWKASVAGLAHRVSQELPTTVTANVVDHQAMPPDFFVECSGKLVRHRVYYNRTTCKNAKKIMADSAKFSMWLHLTANTARYVDMSRDQVCNDTTTVSGCDIGGVIMGSYDQSHACDEVWRKSYGFSPSEFFIELAKDRCVSSGYKCRWMCSFRKGCTFHGSMRVECPFRIVYFNAPR